MASRRDQGYSDGHGRYLLHRSSASYSSSASHNSSDSYQSSEYNSSQTSYESSPRYASSGNYHQYEAPQPARYRSSDSYNSPPYCSSSNHFYQYESTKPNHYNQHTNHQPSRHIYQRERTQEYLCNPPQAYNPPLDSHQDGDDQFEDYEEQASQVSEDRITELLDTLQARAPNKTALLHGFLVLNSSDLMTKWLAGPGWGDAERKPGYNVVTGHKGAKWVENAYGEEVREPRSRRAWRVFLAYNTWTPIKKLAVSRSTRELLSHWGVCFTPVDRPNGPYRVYSMDFEDEFRQKLVVQTTWWTEERGWVGKIYDDELEYVERKDECCEAILYFSDAELAVTAQVVLQRYLRHHYGKKKLAALTRGAHEYQKHCEKYITGWDAGNGRLYGLLSRNCQDYATYLFKSLLYQDWGNPERLDDCWYPEEWLLGSWRPAYPEVGRSKKWNRIGEILKHAAKTGVKAAPIAVQMIILYKLYEDFFEDFDED